MNEISFLFINKKILLINSDIQESDFINKKNKSQEHFHPMLLAFVFLYRISLIVSVI